MQLHVMLFRAEGGGWTDVYAHREKPSQNPTVATDHYRGRGQDIEGGVEQLRMLLLDHGIRPVGGRRNLEKTGSV